MDAMFALLQQRRKLRQLAAQVAALEQNDSSSKNIAINSLAQNINTIEESVVALTEGLASVDEYITALPNDLTTVSEFVCWLQKTINVSGEGRVVLNANTAHRQQLVLTGDMTEPLVLENMTKTRPQVLLEIIDGGFIVDFSGYAVTGAVPEGTYLVVVSLGYDELTKYVAFSPAVLSEEA